MKAEHFSVRSTWSSHLWNLASEQDRPVLLFTIESKSVSVLFKTPRCTRMLFAVAVVLFVVIVFSCLNWLYYGLLPPGSARLHCFFLFFSDHLFPPAATLEPTRQADRNRKWTLEIKASKPILSFDHCPVKVCESVSSAKSVRHSL